MEHLHAELWYLCLAHTLLKAALGKKKKKNKIHWGKASAATVHEVLSCSGWFSPLGPNTQQEVKMRLFEGIQQDHPFTANLFSPPRLSLCDTSAVCYYVDTGIEPDRKSTTKAHSYRSYTRNSCATNVPACLYFCMTANQGTCTERWRASTKGVSTRSVKT